MKKKALLPALMICALLVAACGTAATPVPNSQTLEAEAAAAEADENGEAVAVVPTDTPAPTDTPEPTDTPVPPTETPTDEPEPVEEPVEEEEEPEAPAETDQITLLVSRFGDPVNGQAIFNRTLSTAGGDFACSVCHSVEPDAPRGIGPGFWNYNEVAGERVEGQTAEVYTYRSIIYPNEYIVDDYPGNVMPLNYEEILSDQELYDLSAYVLSIGD